MATLLLVLMAVAAHGQSTPAETGLKATLNKFLAAASHWPSNADDKKTFDQFFADEVIYTRSAGAVVDKRAIMRTFDIPLVTDPHQSFSAEDVLVHSYGDFAVVAFKLVQKLDDGTRNEFRNTGTFQKRDGRWQAVAWQSTKVPKENE